MHNPMPDDDDEFRAALLAAAAPTPAPVSPKTPLRAQWVAGLVASRGVALPLDELLELASETLPGGPLATIQALLGGLIRRHEGDDATLAALVAIERLHLPAALEHAQR